MENLEIENSAALLTNFLQSFRDKIFDFYNKVYFYIKDLLNEKKINLRIKLSSESEITVERTIETIIKTIKIALMTIGVSNEKLLKDERELKEIIKKKRIDYLDYNSFFERDIKEYINKILLQLLIEYLIDFDLNKIQNMDLFDLLPHKFINHLNQFKQDYVNSSHIKELKDNISEIEVFINPTDLSVNETAFKILKLNTSINESESSTQKLQNPQENTTQKSISSKSELSAREVSKNFLDYIENAISINSKTIKEVNININNLINSKDKILEFFNLENLYFYIIILKILNLEIPFKNDEIIELTKKYINGKVFSSSKFIKPDPINIFYGLAIFSELNLLNSTSVIDINNIKKFLEYEIKNFLPIKLHLNFYTLLSLNLLERSGEMSIDKSNLLSKVLNLNILTDLEQRNLILDIFEHLMCIKLLDKETDLSNFKALYIMELKILMTPNGLIKETITDSAKVLFILDLLNSKTQEANLFLNSLNFIIYYTKFFAAKNLDKDFNWKIDKLAFTIELRMLFWALLASSQYSLMLK